MKKCCLLILAVFLGTLIIGIVGLDDIRRSDEAIATAEKLSGTGYDNSRDLKLNARRQFRRRRKLHNGHYVSRLPVTDDGGPKEEEKGPHHYKHYRCSACVRDKDKREREREEAREAEILKKFEAQTNKGLAEAQSAALHTADTVYDSAQGGVVNSSNITITTPTSASTSNTTKRLRLRL